jgi:hypothetical protein
MTMTEINNGTQSRSVEERIHGLETAQAVQAATTAGAEATHAAVEAGMMSTTTAMQAGNMAAMVAGAAGFVVGAFFGLAVARR